MIGLMAALALGGCVAALGEPERIYREPFSIHLEREVRGVRVTENVIVKNAPSDKDTSAVELHHVDVVPSGPVSFRHALRPKLKRLTWEKNTAWPLPFGRRRFDFVPLGLSYDQATKNRVIERGRIAVVLQDQIDAYRFPDLKDHARVSFYGDIRPRLMGGEHSCEVIGPLNSSGAFDGLARHCRRVIGRRFGVIGSFLGEQGGTDGRPHGNGSDNQTQTSKPASPSAPRSGFISAVGSIPLGAKVGITIGLTLAACGIQALGVIRLWRGRGVSGALLWLSGLAGLLSSLPLWW